jgi:hypothetical protein
VTLKREQNLKYLPCAFTEHGAIMAATILNSPEAVAMSVFVVRAFMQMREYLATMLRYSAGWRRLTKLCAARFVIARHLDEASTTSRAASRANTEAH